MMFKVGQKVVAIKSTTRPVYGYVIKKGQTYTCIGYSKHPASPNQILLLEQPHNSPNSVGETNCCAPDKWFRPLELDYSFVEEVISQLKKQPETV